MNPASLLGSSRSAFLEKGSCAAGLLVKQCRAVVSPGAINHGCCQVSSPELTRHCSYDPLRTFRLNTALKKSCQSMGAQRMLENEVY